MNKLYYDHHKLIFKHLSQKNDIQNFNMINRKIGHIISQTKEVQMTEYPHPNIFEKAEIIESRYKHLYAFQNEYNQNMKFIISIEDEDDYDLIKNTKAKIVTEKLFKQCKELRVLFSEGVDVNHFLGYKFESLTIDFSIFSMNDMKNCSAQDLVKLFTPSLKKVVLNNCDLDDKFFPTVLDVISKCTKDCSVQLNVSKNCDYLYALDELRKINSNIHVFVNYQVFANYSVRTTNALYNEVFYLHPQVFQTPLELPGDIEYRKEVEEILKKYVIKKVRINKCVSASIIPEADIYSLKINPKIPTNFYLSNALKHNLNEIEISEKTPEHRMKEEYDFSDFTELYSMKVVDDFPEKQKKKRTIKLPQSLKKLECETNFCDFGYHILVNGSKGIEGLTNLTYLSFKEFGGSFKHVTFPKSLKELEFHRATKLHKIDQFEHLTNITKLVITDTEKVEQLHFPPHLKVLNFTHNPHIKEFDVMHLTQLTELELTRYGGKSMKLPKSLKHFEMSDSQDITCIDLSTTLIEDIAINTCDEVTQIKLPKTVKQFRMNDMCNLEEIDLSFCSQCLSVELDCLEVLNRLRLPLSLERIVIGDVEQLEEFQQLKSFVHLRYCQLVTVPCVKELICPPTLRSLVLENLQQLVELKGLDKNICRSEIINCPNLKK